MKTRRSVRNQNILFKELFCPTPEPKTAPPRLDHLDMTADEIDAAYWNIGKAARTTMKKQAAQEALRKAAQAQLKEEEGQQ